MPTNFLQHNPTANNQDADEQYQTDALRTGGVTVDAILPSPFLNKTWYQASTFIAAFATALSNKGYSVLDGDINALEAVLANILTTADEKAALINVPWSPTPNFDCSKSNGFQINMLGNVTNATLSGWTPGQEITIVVVNAATAYTFAPINGVHQWQPMNPPANSIVIQTLYARLDNTLWSKQQDLLLFTPVQQGTGVGQLSNLIKIGWSTPGRLKATVDVSDLGNFVFDTQLNAAVAPVQTQANATAAALTAFINSFGNTTGEFIVPQSSGPPWIVKFGTTATIPGSGTLNQNFPVAFPNSCSTVVVSTYGPTDRITFLVSFDKNGFVVGNNGSGCAASWVAIGQ
jgi:hypothetical protein